MLVFYFSTRKPKIHPSKWDCREQNQIIILVARQQVPGICSCAERARWSWMEITSPWEGGLSRNPCDLRLAVSCCAAPSISTHSCNSSSCCCCSCECWLMVLHSKTLPSASRMDSGRGPPPTDSWSPFTTTAHAPHSYIYLVLVVLQRVLWFDFAHGNLILTGVFLVFVLKNKIRAFFQFLQE